MTKLKIGDTLYRNVCIFVAIVMLLALASACEKSLTDSTVKPGDLVMPVYVRDAATGKCVELNGSGEGFMMHLTADVMCQRQ